MRFIKMCSAAILAAAMAVTVPACTGSAGARVYWVEEEPPPPRRYTVIVRPGLVWVDGRWERDSGTWRWRDGYYVRARGDAYYVQGRWVNDGNRWTWRPGHWRGNRAERYRWR